MTARPIPATTRALAKSRPCFPGGKTSPWPLRDASGMTWAERARLRDAARERGEAA